MPERILLRVEHAVVVALVARADRVARGARKARGRRGNLRERAHQRSSALVLPSKRRATTSIWICCVPSKMSRIFESRAHFSSSSPSSYARGPTSSTQRSVSSLRDARRLRLRHRRFERVRDAVVGHPRRLEREQPRGLELGFETLELDARRTMPRADRRRASREHLARPLERRARDAERHRGDDRARVVERLHHAGERLLRVDVGAAEDVRLRDAAVLEHDRRGIRRADAELVIEPHDVHARRALRDEERLDRGAAERQIERRPHDDRVRALARGHEDLLAVEHPLLAVEARGRADRGRVGAGARLGDRHRDPLIAVLRLLLLGADRGERGVAEALARNRQREADVAARELDHAEHGGHVRAVLRALRLGSRLRPCPSSASSPTRRRRHR